jgi:hypothetical protein
MRHLTAVALGFALVLPAAAQTPSAEAVAACEKSARETLRQTRGAMADATFTGAPAVQPGAAGDDVTLRGQGRYRSAASAAPQSFSYSCMVNPKTALVAGIVLRDAAAPAARAPSAAVEPDLARVSPEACDAAAAGAIKQRWPQLAQLQFNVAARRLDPGNAGEWLLSGQGAAVPAPGLPVTHFSYRCTLDARSGRVLATTVGP